MKYNLKHFVQHALTGTTDDEYRKKPVIVEAYQVTSIDIESLRLMSYDISWPQWFAEAVKNGIIFYSEGIRIKTLEGTSYDVAPTYWIIRGVKGELWPVRNDIFRQTYEKVAA